MRLRVVALPETYDVQALHVAALGEAHCMQTVPRSELKALVRAKQAFPACSVVAVSDHGDVVHTYGKSRNNLCWEQIAMFGKACLDY